VARAFAEIFLRSGLKNAITWHWYFIPHLSSPRERSTSMSNYLPPSIRVAQQLTESAVLHGAHSSVVLLAVKCLKRPLSEMQQSLMASRLSKLEELRHPHVVRYYLNSLGSNADEISIVMEAWGVSVASLIAGKQHCGKEYVASFAVQVLQALIGLHSVGVVHGDIKRSNILLGGTVYKVWDVDEAATGLACYMSLPAQGPTLSCQWRTRSATRTRPGCACSRCSRAGSRTASSTTSVSCSPGFARASSCAAGARVPVLRTTTAARA